MDVQILDTHWIACINSNVAYFYTTNFSFSLESIIFRRELKKLPEWDDKKFASEVCNILKGYQKENLVEFSLYIITSDKDFFELLKMKFDYHVNQAVQELFFKEFPENKNNELKFFIYEIFRSNK